MTKAEALALLAQAPRSDRRSKVGRTLTEAEIVERAIEVVSELPDGAQLSSLYEHRVRQIVENKTNPKGKSSHGYSS